MTACDFYVILTAFIQILEHNSSFSLVYSKVNRPFKTREEIDKRVIPHLTEKGSSKCKATQRLLLNDC